MEKKPYCTQNDGDCPSCSLVNYGRDCQNNPVDYAAFAASAMGKKGGSSRTPKKSASSAANLDKARADGRVGGWKKGVPRRYKITADVISGIMAVDEFTDEVEMCTPEFFTSLLDQPFDGVIGTTVNKKTFDELKDKYGIR